MRLLIGLCLIFSICFSDKDLDELKRSTSEKIGKEVAEAKLDLYEDLNAVSYQRLKYYSNERIETYRIQREFYKEEVQDRVFENWVLRVMVVILAALASRG